MTAKRDIRDEDWVDDLPVPPWVRPLSLDEQAALIKEAQDEFDRGEGIPHDEAMRIIDAMLAKYH
ncbi:hypothetical protein KX816_16795 [Sphingosinicellaceae bacterium]|nr:hypothetical protein KX816_16795 [Sphingosinicellaceae bacterium]